MKFIHNDLGHRKRGEIVEITLTSGANVRLMDSSNFSETNVKQMGSNLDMRQKRRRT